MDYLKDDIVGSNRYKLQLVTPKVTIWQHRIIIPALQLSCVVFPTKLGLDNLSYINNLLYNFEIGF